MRCIIPNMTTLEREVLELKKRIDRLESNLRRLIGARPVAIPAAGEADRAALTEWLKAEGLVREPMLEEASLASEWEAMSEDERQAFRHELDHVPAGPLASDIILENRR